MSKVLDKVRQAKQDTEERLTRGKGGGLRAQFWRPQNGENRIRIMPSWLNPTNDPDFQASAEMSEFDGQFWREIAQHWNLTEDQKGPVLCAKKTPGLSDDCPVCELVEELKKDKSNLEAQNAVKQIKAKVAFLYNVVDMKEPEYTAEDAADWVKSRPDSECPFAVGDVKVQVYAVPLTVHDAILGLINSNRSDITRLDKGRCVKLTKYPNKDPKLTRYQVMPEFEETSFDLGSTELPQLHQMGFTMEYEELLDLLQTGVGGNFAHALPEGAIAKALPVGGNSVETPKSSVDLEAELRSHLSS